MIRRLLSPEYWVVPEPGPLDRAWPVYGLLALFFVAVSALGCRRLLLGRRRAIDAAALVWLWIAFSACVLGLAAVAGRAFQWRGLSARIWPASLACLALVAVLAYLGRALRLPRWLSRQAEVLIFQAPSAGDGRPHGIGNRAAWVAVLVLHLAGASLVLRLRFGLGLWAAPVVLFLVLAPQWPRLVRLQRPDLLALTPLILAYAGALLLLLYRSLGLTVVPWQGLAIPDPMTSAFYLDGVLLAAVTYSLVCQVPGAFRRPDSTGPAWRRLAIGILALTAIWSSMVYMGKRTHGVTGSDPYAYAQMAVDLVERRTLLHRSALFPDVAPLGIAWAPLQPVGYHVPLNQSGDAPSVWATGASVLLAAGYSALGEDGLYIMTPLTALLALGATWLLAQEVLREDPPAVRALCGAICVALTATSPENVDRLLVPMADAQAQLFTIAALYFSLRAMRSLEGEPVRALVPVVLAGITFGWAFWVRHTQLVMAPAVALALCWVRRKGRAGTWHIGWPLLASGAAALVAAAPDLAYRWRVFGGPLATETTELPAMGLEHVGTAALEVLRGCLAAGEWGYLFPFALSGTALLARRRPRAAAVLGTAFAAMLALHLTYQFLRLRDLISLFPLVNLAAAYGIVTIARAALRLARERASRPQLGRALLGVCAVACLLLGLALSRWHMLGAVDRPGWASFGYVDAAQRLAFDRMRQITPPDAVIGASLNAGAVMLHAKRDAVRPYDWSEDEEWPRFLAAMRERGRPVYLLDDGERMGAFIEEQQKRYRLTVVQALRVPLYPPGQADGGLLYRLEWE